MIGWVLRILVTLIGSSLRYRMVEPHGLLTNAPPTPLIFAFWHNRIFLLPHLFRKHWDRRRRVAVLISASRDGEKLANVLSCFNLVCVRGSTSRRGKEALLELTRLVQDGHDVGITPDGPRGPKYRVQSGVIDLAQLTQAPIVPISYVVSRQFVFKKAWDNFAVPLPFAHCTVRIGPLVTVPRDADAATSENKRLELERILQTLSE